MEHKYGQMVPSMKASGSRTKPMDKASLCMLTEISTKDSGSMIRQKVKELTLIQMEHSTRDSG